MANTIKLGTDSNWAVKENNLLAYNDENNIFKPIDFEFTRDSGATRVNEQGLIENVPSGVPRIDFSDGKGSLLLEPTSTNLITYSDGIITDYGTTTNVTQANNPIVGFDNSTQFGDNSLTRIFYDRSHTTDIGQIYTLSCYVQMDDNSTPNPSSANNLGDFCLVISGVVSPNPQVKHIANSVYKITSTFTAETNSSANGLVKYSTQSTKGFRVTGLQLEELSYPTSYIPTSGATATRNAETSSKANISNFINSSEGVLYAEMSALVDIITPPNKYITLSDGTLGNQVAILYEDTNRLVVRMDVGGNNQAFGIIKSSNFTQPTKLAIVWSFSGLKVFLDGILAYTSTNFSNTFPSNVLTEINFNTGVGGNPFYGKVKDIRVYDTVLTDTQLQQLTS